MSRAGLWWLIGCGAAFGLLLVLASIGNQTVILAPAPRRFDEIFFACGGVSAIVSGWIAWAGNEAQTSRNRQGLTVIGFLLGFFGVAASLSFAAEFVENRVYFPPSTTITYDDARIEIANAFYKSGRNSGWIAKVGPYLTGLSITREDYEFMLRHRGPVDGSVSPNLIVSNGYFCIRATLQKAGSAMRLLHVARTLPRGSVTVCPIISVPVRRPDGGAGKSAPASEP